MSIFNISLIDLVECTVSYKYLLLVNDIMFTPSDKTSNANISDKMYLKKKQLFTPSTRAKLSSANGTLNYSFNFLKVTGAYLPSLPLSDKSW